MQDQYGDPRYLREIARCVVQRNEMIGVEPPTAPPDRFKVLECGAALTFRHYLLLRDIFGDPPYKPKRGLTAEDYAALVAEHEQDPHMHKVMAQLVEWRYPTARGRAKGATVGQSQQAVSPENSPAEDSSVERSP